MEKAAPPPTPTILRVWHRVLYSGTDRMTCSGSLDSNSYPFEGQMYWYRKRGRVMPKITLVSFGTVFGFWLTWFERLASDPTAYGSNFISESLRSTTWNAVLRVDPDEPSHGRHVHSFPRVGPYPGKVAIQTIILQSFLGGVQQWYLGTLAQRRTDPLDNLRISSL